MRLAALVLVLIAPAAFSQSAVIDLKTGVLQIDDLLVRKADNSTMYVDATLAGNATLSSFNVSTVSVVPAPGVHTEGLSGTYVGNKFAYLRGTLTPATGSCAVPGFNGTGSSTVTLAVQGSAITMTQDAFPNDVCHYTGTISNGVASGTFQCSNFNDGTWTSSVLLNTSQNTLMAQLSLDGDLCDYDAHYLGFRL